MSTCKVTNLNNLILQWGTSGSNTITLSVAYTEKYQLVGTHTQKSHGWTLIVVTKSLTQCDMVSKEPNDGNETYLTYNWISIGW